MFTCEINQEVNKTKQETYGSDSKLHYEFTILQSIDIQRGRRKAARNIMAAQI